MRKVIGIFILTLLTGTSLISAIGIDDYSLDDTLFTNNYSNVEWVNTYGNDRYEMLQCVQTTSDGGYIACGVKSAYDIDIPEGEFYRPWVIKTNSNGDLEWEWSIYGFEYEGRFFSAYLEVYCMFIIEMSNGGFITGYRLYCQADDDYWVSAISKLTVEGEEEWREYCMDSLEWNFGPHSILELDDGSFILAGFSGTTEIDDLEDMACLYKIDSNGQEQWRKEYNYGELDSLWALCKTNDGGYLSTGWADYADYLMIKTDSNGNKQWDKILGGESNDFAHARNCYQTDDGGYIMSGYTHSFGNGQSDTWIVKTDSEGNMEWNRTYGGKSSDPCWSFESTIDDTYVFCVTYNYGSISADKEDIHLVKMDNEGHIIWIQYYDGEGRQFGQHICNTNDGGFIVSGRNGRYFNDESDGILVKFAPFNNQRPNKPSINGPSKGKPDEEYSFTVSASDADGDTIVSYMWDWGDGNYSDWLETSEVNYTWSTEDSFEIRVKAMDEHGGESDWSDPLEFSTPKTKEFILFVQLLERLIERFPMLERIIKTC
jgi:hypothetical protein